MTLRPRILPVSHNLPAKLALIAPEVPGLAYYTALTAKPARLDIPPRRSPAAEALDVLYGYFSPQG
jgi:hypothetical protein